MMSPKANRKDTVQQLNPVCSHNLLLTNEPEIIILYIVIIWVTI